MSKPQSPLTTSEVARILGKDARTIQRRADAGDIPTIGKLPGRTGAYLFDRSTIESLTAPGTEFPHSAPGAFSRAEGAATAGAPSAAS